MKTIIVEDELLIAKVVSLFLQQLGYEVVGIAGTSTKAIELIHKHKPTLAIVDFNLGVEDSSDVLAALNNLKIPSVIVSGRPRNLLPIQYQATPFLSKPLTPERLRETLASIQGSVEIKSEPDSSPLKA